MKISRNILLLVVVTFFLFLPSLFGNFVWDDEELIVNNVQIASPDFVLNAFGGAVFNNGGSAFINNYYRPLMITSFGIITHLFGKTAFWFHLFQLSLHLLNVCLVYLLFKRKLLPALIFAVHPLNVESVVYIAATGDTLCLTFILLTILALSRLKNTLTLFSLTLLALLSKETGAIVLPLGLLINFKKYYLPAVLAVIAYLILRFPVGHTGFGASGIFPMQNTDLLVRLLTVPKELFYYLTNFIYPYNLTVSQHWLVTFSSFFDFWIPFFVDLFFLIFAFIKGSRFFLVFFLSIILALNIFPLDATVAPRWFYIPIVGLLGLFDLQKFKKIIIVWVVFLAVLSLRRSFEWHSAYSLYSADIVSNGESFDLQNNLGVELHRSGNWQKAKIHFQKSTELNPKWWVNWSNLCAVVQQEGQYDLAKSYCQKSLDTGVYYIAYENMAKLLYYHFSPDEGRAFAKDALKFLPYDQILIQIASSKETSQ